MILVSVIIPNYNHAPYLKQRLDSVLNQTYTNIEVIILDDCSTDNSREIIDSYRNHPKVKHIIYSEINSGSTFIQWDKGISMAKGECVWLAESDDWCEHTFLEELIPAFENDAKVSVAYCQTLCVNDKLEFIGVGSHVKLHDTISGDLFVKEYMLGWNSIYNASMAVFRKSALAGISDNYRSFFYCGDWLFWTELASKGNVYVSGKVLNYFRKHGKDVSSKAAREGLLFTEGKKIFEFIVSRIDIDKTTLSSIYAFKTKEYLRFKKHFENAKVKENAVKALQSIDPYFKHRLFKQRIYLMLSFVRKIGKKLLNH